MSFYLTNREIFKMQGEGLIDFLQGLTTNDMNKLNSQKSIYTCILNPSGKFLFDFFVVKITDSEFLIDVADIFSKDFELFIKKYKLRRKISIEKLENFCVISSDLKQDESFFQDERFSGKFQFRSIVKKMENINQNIEYNSFLIENKIVDGRFLTKEKSVILEFGFEDFAVDFNKGCYIGQELITRAKRVGQVRKFIEIIEVSSLKDGDDFITKDEKFALILSRKNDQ